MKIVWIMSFDGVVANVVVLDRSLRADLISYGRNEMRLTSRSHMDDYSPWLQ